MARRRVQLQAYERAFSSWAASMVDVFVYSSQTEIYRQKFTGKRRMLTEYFLFNSNQSRSDKINGLKTLFKHILVPQIPKRRKGSGENGCSTNNIHRYSKPEMRNVEETLLEGEISSHMSTRSQSQWTGYLPNMAKIVRQSTSTLHPRGRTSESSQI